MTRRYCVSHQGAPAHWPSRLGTQSCTNRATEHVAWMLSMDAYVAQFHGDVPVAGLFQHHRLDESHQRMERG